MEIRTATENNFEEVYSVECEAFGFDKEANLVKDLLDDPTAAPAISLLSFENNRAIGHILFTRAYIAPETVHSLYILAPLAVIPEFQNRGVGGMLIEEGLRRLREMGVDLVFVLGHPDYYPRHGFIPDAAKLGFEAPYPIPDIYAGAWMVQELSPGVTGTVKGKIRCAETLNRPQHWRE